MITNSAEHLHIHFSAATPITTETAGTTASAESEHAGHEPGDERQEKSAAKHAKSEQEMSMEEKKQLQELRARDAEVRAHEQAHAAAAGNLARGGPSYEYQRGPDGRLYAVGGEVQIDTAPVAGDPEATLRKAEQIQRAALAPAEPSSQDQAVAAQATAMAAQARAEIAKEKSAEQNAELQSTDNANTEHDMHLEAHPETKDSTSICPICGGKHSAEAHTAVVTYDAVAASSQNFVLQIPPQTTA